MTDLFYFILDGATLTHRHCTLGNNGSWGLIKRATVILLAVWCMRGFNNQTNELHFKKNTNFLFIFGQITFPSNFLEE